MSRTRSNIARPTGDALRVLYLELGMGCPEIAHLFERDGKTVFWWLRQAGIPTRRRGSDPAQHFKAGQRSAFAGRRHRPESIAKVKASTIADGRVPYLRGGQHWLAGAPPEANPNWNGGATPERQEFYRSPEWTAACRAIWQRDDACCRRCRLDWRAVDRETTPTFHIHHVVSFAVETLRAELSNLVLLCRPCHLFVHSNANTAREYLKAAEREFAMPSLFDLEAA